MSKKKIMLEVIKMENQGRIDGRTQIIGLIETPNGINGLKENIDQERRNVLTTLEQFGAFKEEAGQVREAVLV